MWPRLMHEKLATREALSSRGLIDVERESSCSFCFRGVESCKHMFFDCNFSSNIWRGIWTWIGIQGPLETDSFINLLKFGEIYNLVGDSMVYLATSK